MIKRSLLLSLLLAAGSLQAQDQPPPADSAPDTGSVQAQGQVAAADDPNLAIARGIVEGACFGCHAGDDKSKVPAEKLPQQTLWPAPSLAGQHAEYLYKQLLDYKSMGGAPAARANPDMQVWASMLPSDELVMATAKFYASQKLDPAPGTDNEQGKLIWRAGLASKSLPACASCHGPAGKGMAAQYPALAGQVPEYIEAQMKAFRNVERTNDPSKMMRDIAIKMTDPEIKAVSDYAASLR